MIKKLLQMMLGTTPKSHARKLFEELKIQDQQFMMPGCEPRSYTLKMEIPKFSEELAKIANKTVDQYIEYLVVECLYANRLHNSIKMDGYMPPDVSYRKPPKLYH